MLAGGPFQLCLMSLSERPGDFDGSWRSGVEEEEDEWVDGRVGHNGHSDDCLHTNILRAE